jgi:anti-anti-sigma factor
MLNVEEQSENEKCTIKLSGELVATNLDVLKKKVHNLILNGTSSITFDMSDTESVDSAGVGFIAATHNSLEKNGGVFKMIGLSKDMYQFFICLRMNTHFTIEEKL